MSVAQRKRRDGVLKKGGMENRAEKNRKIHILSFMFDITTMSLY